MNTRMIRYLDEQLFTTELAGLSLSNTIYHLTGTLRLLYPSAPARPQSQYP
jgi:hypothetical protein